MLPSSAHPIVDAFTASLKTEAGTRTKSGKVKRSSNLQKVSQVLGWRNRFSQSEYYPIELSLPGMKVDMSKSEAEIVVSFQVKQFQRGEVENTYGTGATVWPASLVLLKYLEHIVSTGRMTKKKNMVIGDLGSGTGVTSIAAALLFPDSVVICTDGCDPVVELAKENCSKCIVKKRSQSNENECTLPSENYNDIGLYRIGTSSIRVSKYWWGDGTILNELRKHDNTTTEASFDILLISDCVLPKLYPIEPLIDALDECMTASTIAIVTFEYRYFPKYDPKTFFFDLASKRGFHVKQVPLEEQHSIYSVDDIEVWEIRKISEEIQNSETS